MTAAGRRAAIGVFLAFGAGHLARAQDGTIDRGRQLFIGAIPFAHGGPACAACHDTAALARPGGGTMGPSLTDIGGRIGPQGIASALRTLYFPTMVPLFRERPLIAGEQEALAAFLGQPSQAAHQPAFAPATLGATAVAGCVLLLAVTGFIGRARVHSVRLSLLSRAAAGRKAMR